MNDIKHKEVRKLISCDELDFYPSRSLKSRDVEMAGSHIYFLDVGVNPYITFRYTTAADRDQDLEALSGYLG